MNPQAAVRAALAAAPSGFDAPQDDRAEVDATAGKGAGVYGELTLDAFARLLHWLAPTPDDQLIDLGSGPGTLPLLAAATTAVGRAVGVELSPFRHAAALAARDALTAHLPLAAARVELRHDDLRHTDLHDATLIYVGSTCFPDALLAAAARRIAEGHAPRLRAFLSTRALPAPWNLRLPQRGELDLPATWSPKVRVVIHRAPR